jgi:DUF4097 and DUF4098 domain-containing protein YvlB
VIVEDVAGAIEVELTNGPMHVRHCRGAVKATVSNGPMQVERVAGPLEANVANGPLNIEEVTAGIQAAATNGPIVYRGAVAGDLDLRSSRGGIVLELPKDSRFELDAEADRGGVYCEFDVREDGTPSAGRAPRIVLRTERGEIVLRQLARAGVA